MRVSRAATTERTVQAYVNESCSGHLSELFGPRRARGEALSIVWGGRVATSIPAVCS